MHLIAKLFSLLLAGLTIWISSVAVRIECRNADAGFYLPRRDLYDGKWRSSGENTPRDQLRALVGGIGFAQYPLALVTALTGMALAVTTPRVRRFAGLCAAVTILCLGLAFHRGYLGSLGT